MQASTGDRIVIKGHRVGEPPSAPRASRTSHWRSGSPYYVRWDDGSEALIYPGSDAMVAPTTRRKRHSN